MVLPVQMPTALSLNNREHVTSKSSETIATFHKKSSKHLFEIAHLSEIFPRSNHNSCLSPFMSMHKDFICYTSEKNVKDIDTTDVLQLL